MLLLAAAALMLIAGSLFLAYELSHAPVGFEDAAGFHTVGQRKASHPGSRVLRSENDPVVGLGLPGTIAR